MGVGLYSAICFPCLLHLGLQFDVTVVSAVSGCLWRLHFFPPSSIPINIATVEAAKAKGTHGCGLNLMSLFCVCPNFKISTFCLGFNVLSCPHCFYLTDYCITVYYLIAGCSCIIKICWTFNLRDVSQAIKESQIRHEKTNIKLNETKLASD